MDAGTCEVFSQPGIIEEASIEPHLPAWVCNNVRGSGYSGAAEKWGSWSGMWGKKGGWDLFFGLAAEGANGAKIGFL